MVSYYQFVAVFGEKALAVPAAVKAGNPTACADFDDTVAGFGRSLVAMARKYAPQAVIGLQPSAWAVREALALVTLPPTYNLEANADAVSQFLADCGADVSDLRVMEMSDRDAGFYAAQGQPNRLWLETEAEAAGKPSFERHLRWAERVSENLKKPILWWQVPFGNSGQPNTKVDLASAAARQGYTDNRVDWTFANLAKLTAVHSVGVAFGDGLPDQTHLSTDGSNFAAKLKASSAAPVKICP